VRLLIHIFAFVPVTVCTCVHIGCVPQLRCRQPTDPVCQPCWPVFTCLSCEKSCDRRCVQTGGTISGYFSSQTLLNKDRRCCESWRRRARSWCSECCGWYDWQRPLSRPADTAESRLMKDTLTTFSSSFDCYDDWRRPSPTFRLLAYDASSPFHRCHVLLSCHNQSAAQRLPLATSF